MFRRAMTTGSGWYLRFAVVSIACLGFTLAGASDGLQGASARAASPPTGNKPVHITVNLDFSENIDSTAPATQQDLRSWTSSYHLTLVFGISPKLYLRDLQQGLARPSSLLVYGLAGGRGRYDETTTRGKCGGRYVASGRPLLEAEASQGGSLVLAISFADYMSAGPNPPSCVQAPAGVTFNGSGLLGTCVYYPKLPLKLFTSANTECTTRANTMYFTLDPKQLHLAAGEVPTFLYSYSPNNTPAEAGAYEVKIKWTSQVDAY
jgi:hypothetical protein